MPRARIPIGPPVGRKAYRVDEVVEMLGVGRGTVNDMMGRRHAQACQNRQHHSDCGGQRRYDATRCRRMNDDYFVYALLDETGTPFYIGCAKASKHDHRFPPRVRYRQHIVAARNSPCEQVEKNKIIRRLLDAKSMPRYREISSGLTKADGYALEREMIAKIGRLVLGTGPLTNIRDGGWHPSDGACGHDAGMTAQRAARRRQTVALRELLELEPAE
jgi:hypothetical protein